MKYHQNIAIDGVDQPAEYTNRKDSNFFNEGKWKNFIEPLLPPDPKDRTFVEIGCNLGLYCKMATEYGFRDVWGVEADVNTLFTAERYRDSNGMDYKLLPRRVGTNFTWDELPVADVVLLSNMHYYVPIQDFLLFVDRMYHKTIYCIVVSRAMRDKKHGHPLPEIEPLRIYFQDWETERILQTSKNHLEGDPHPRRVHSLLFRSRLQRQPIDDHTTSWWHYPKHQELIDIVQEGRDIQLEDTKNYQYWVRRKQTDKKGRKDRWSDEEVRAHVQYRLDFTKDMLTNGMREPILVRPDRIGLDGGNRAAVLKCLGYDSVIVRLV